MLTEQQQAAIEEAVQIKTDKFFPEKGQYRAFFAMALKSGMEEVISNPEKYGLRPVDLGACKRCKAAKAVTDYNGHGHYVCQSCDNVLNNEFDEEYR